MAYEPVWAIGTGLTPTSGDVEQIHGFIRELLTSRFKADGAGMRILYGGSVKPSNAAELMAVKNVNGALVGGASLKAADFLAIAAGLPLANAKQDLADRGWQCPVRSCNTAQLQENPRSTIGRRLGAVGL